MQIRRFLCLGTMVAALVPATAFAAPSSKGFRDWLAACDNTWRCVALSLPPENAGNFAYLKLTRPAGPEGMVTLEIKLHAEELKAPLAMTLALDGAPFPAAGKSWPVTNVDDGDASITLTPAEAEALIAASRKATKLGVGLADLKLDISLAGAVATMLWIDQEQGRLETTTALMSKGQGTRPPPAPDLPVVTARPTASVPPPSDKAAKTLTTALRKHLKARDPDGCEDPGDPDTTSDAVWALSRNLNLVALACSRGAYNVSFDFWMVSGSDVARAKPAVFPQTDGKTVGGLVNGNYDPATGLLDYFDKARGIGDCGVLGTYAWTGTGFALSGFSEMGECRQLRADDWMVLWRSEVKTAK